MLVSTKMRSFTYSVCGDVLCLFRFGPLACIQCSQCSLHGMLKLHNIKSEWTCLNATKCKSCLFESATPLTQLRAPQTCLKFHFLSWMHGRDRSISSGLAHEWNCYIKQEWVQAPKLHRHFDSVASFCVKCKHFGGISFGFLCETTITWHILIRINILSPVFFRRYTEISADSMLSLDNHPKIGVAFE